MGIFYISSARAMTPVDLELVLAVDCSYSVDEVEFRLQMDGMALAFKSKQVFDAIQSGPYGSIAVTVVHWSKSDVQIQALPWTKLDSQDSILGFADQLLQLPRLSSAGGTSISGAIGFSHLLIESNNYTGARRVIDLSADGRNNSGWLLQDVRNNALYGGLTINGLTILNEVPTLHYYFRQKVIGGPGAFVVIANDYSKYPEAILRKLLQEIRQNPISDLPGESKLADTRALPR